MKESLAVLGFGSFFRGAVDAKDIDLLLLHRSTDPASCQFAIECKTHLQRAVPDADVVMLSATEADGNQFLTRSGAVTLGTLHAGELDVQIQALARRIETHGRMGKTGGSI